MSLRLDARLRRLEAQVQGLYALPDGGLAALLAFVERHPIAEAFDLNEELDAETPPRELARCLWEIRRAREDPEGS